MGKSSYNLCGILPVIKVPTSFQRFSISTIMKKIYAEMGFGNDTFFNTEFEEGESEYRVPKFVMPNKIDECYVRIWIKKTVYVLSSKKGFRTVSKDRNKFKLLFGLGGE